MPARFGLSQHGYDRECKRVITVPCRAGAVGVAIMALRDSLQHKIVRFLRDSVGRLADKLLEELKESNDAVHTE